MAFKMRPACAQAPLEVPHFHRWEAASGDPVALFYRVPGGFLLRFPDRGDFTVELEPRAICCTPTPEVSKTVISAVYSNQVLPLLASHDGELVLHASATVGPQGALAFLGKSGRGKSTLAAAFARAGYPFLTDDGLWLEQAGEDYLAKPGRPDVRLWPDSGTAIVAGCAGRESADWIEKDRFGSDPSLPFHNQPARLRAVYVLGEGMGEDPAILRLSPLEAVNEITKYAFILDVEDRSRHRDHFERVVRLVQMVDCFSLDYPRKFESLPQLITAVLEHASSEMEAHPR